MVEKLALPSLLSSFGCAWIVRCSCAWKAGLPTGNWDPLTLTATLFPSKAADDPSWHLPFEHPRACSPQRTKSLAIVKGTTFPHNPQMPWENNIIQIRNHGEPRSFATHLSMGNGLLHQPWMSKYRNPLLSGMGSSLVQRNAFCRADLRSFWPYPHGIGGTSHLSPVTPLPRGVAHLVFVRLWKRSQVLHIIYWYSVYVHTYVSVYIYSVHTYTYIPYIYTIYIYHIYIYHIYIYTYIIYTHSYSMI